MDNGRQILKEILLVLIILIGPSLVAWIFGAWGAIFLLVAVLCVVAHYIMKYQG